MEPASSTALGDTGQAARAASFPSFLAAPFMEATRMSFSLARVMATYSTRISSALLSRSRAAWMAVRAMVGYWMRRSRSTQAGPRP